LSETTDARRKAERAAPYYEQDGITIYHGDCLDVLPQLAPVDHVITDPPYSPHTHAKQWIGAALTAEGKPRVGMAFAELGFAPLTPALRCALATWSAKLARARRQGRALSVALRAAVTPARAHRQGRALSVALRGANTRARARSIAGLRDCESSRDRDRRLYVLYRRPERRISMTERREDGMEFRLSVHRAADFRDGGAQPSGGLRVCGCVLAAQTGCQLRREAAMRSPMHHGRRVAGRRLWTAGVTGW